MQINGFFKIHVWIARRGVGARQGLPKTEHRFGNIDEREAKHAPSVIEIGAATDRRREVQDLSVDSTLDEFVPCLVLNHAALKEVFGDDESIGCEPSKPWL